MVKSEATLVLSLSRRCSSACNELDASSAHKHEQVKPLGQKFRVRLESLREGQPSVSYSQAAKLLIQALFSTETCSKFESRRTCFLLFGPAEPRAKGAPLAAVKLVLHRLQSRTTLVSQTEKSGSHDQ